MTKVYWIKSKHTSIGLETRDRAPAKSKVWVEDSITREPNDTQICHHVLRSNPATRTVRMTSRCGYDRGPRLYNVINGLIAEAQAKRST